MNGPHDLGGQMGFGPVAPEPNEPVFHSGWERLAFGITRCCGAMGHWSIDESRHAQETLHPVDYLSSSYYEKWTKGLEVLLVRHGFVTAAELAAGRKLTGGKRPKQVLAAGGVAKLLGGGSPYDRPLAAPAIFAAGQRVRTINAHPTGHTRLPRYARGRMGRIETVHGGFVFPDSNAHGHGEQPQTLYTVLFAGTELWGPGSDPGLTVSIDAWESYLEPV
jgi:nitrile hydratase subunit beta